MDTTNDDDLDLVYNRNVDDNYLDTNSMDEYFNLDKNSLNNENIDDNDDIVSNGQLDAVSVSEVCINNNGSNSNNLILKLESMGRMKKPAKSCSKSNLSDSVKSATKITKNIFESTNSKLSMDIFNTLNIGSY